MRMSCGVRRPLAAAALSCLVALACFVGAAVPARSEEKPKLELKMGIWMIHQCSGPGLVRKNCILGEHSVSQYMIIRPGGIYEIYYYPTKEFRGRGTYEWDPVNAKVRWLSGINYEMGRGGSVDSDKGKDLIILGTRTYAYFEKP